MVIAPSQEPADAGTEQGMIFLPLGEAVLIDPECELLRWATTSDRVMRRARRHNAMLKDKFATLFATRMVP